MKRINLFTFIFFCSRVVQAQENGTAEIKSGFASYQAVNLQEKIFVHTDKTIYLAGETVWLKIYALLEQSHRLSTVSQVAYAEFSRTGSGNILQEKIHLDSGTGSGSFQIPAGWETGNYVLRVYTSWMKNFPADFFYTQVLSVVNSVRGNVSKKQPVTAIKPTVPIGSGTKEPNSVPIADIGFFPEGGNLVYGIESTVAFKMVDGLNNGMAGTGFLTNQRGDTLVRFQSAAASAHPGVGRFSFQPHMGDSVFAYLLRNGNPVRFPFPKVETAGYTLRLSVRDGARLTLTVRTTLNENNKIIYLLAHSRQVLKYISGAPVRNGQVDFSVDGSVLADGISVFTLLDQDRHPVCERLFFKSPSLPVLQIGTDRQRYEERAPVTFHWQTPVGLTDGERPDLSLSVFRLDPLQETGTGNIISWCYLSSELRGRIDNPNSYLGIGADTVAAADDLMLTQGWRRFSWENVFRGKTRGFDFLPEEEGPVLSAHAENRLNNKPASGISFLLSFPGRHFQFTTATADEKGNLLFTAAPFSGTTMAVILPVNALDSVYRVDADADYSIQAFPPCPDLPVLAGAATEAVTERALALQVENAYRRDEKRKWRPGEAIDSVPFYGRPDRNYHLANYTRFPTMEEIMREFVEDVRVRKEGKNFRFRVMNALFKTFLDGEPMILLDGVPVSNPDRIMQIDPLKIEDIDVISHRFYKGSATFDGIISFRSVTGDLGQSMLDPGAVVVDFEGLQQEREFYAPVYSDSVMRDRPIPDYRTTIAWLPRLKPGKDGKNQVQFYTSDVKGKFAVWAQGMSSAGQPLSAITVIEVGGEQPR